MIPTVQLILYNDKREPTGFERIGIRHNDTRARCNRCGADLQAGQAVRSQAKTANGWRNRGFICLHCARLAILACSKRYLHELAPLEPKPGVVQRSFDVCSPTSFGSGKNVIGAQTVANLLAKAVNP